MAALTDRIRADRKLLNREVNPQQLIGLEKLLTEPIEKVYYYLNTSENGFTSETAEALIDIYGFNELTVRKRKISVLQFLEHFKNPILLILLFAGLISIYFGELVNAIIIFTIIGVSVTLDYYQEAKADKAAALLKQKVTTTATVLRDGVRKEIRISEIIPGDIIYLSAGDMIPADSRIISAKDFFVNQSSLTGESLPVEKKPVLEKAYKNITEYSNAVFLGTTVVSGTAIAVALKTGRFTVYGRIAVKLLAKPPETEYQRGLRRFGYLLLQVTFALIIFVFFVNALIRGEILNSLIFAVALAVGLTPDLLPMILSVNLSSGAIQMAKKGVIVKKLAAIQNFGGMNVLCSDKTGTLTENKIVLVKHIDLNGLEDEKVLLYSYLNSYYQTGLKSPLDEAVLKHEELNIREYKKIDEIPFDFTRKRVTVVVEYGGERILISKGAPEEVHKICSSIEDNGEVKSISEEFKRKITEKYIELSREGYRVLSVCYRVDRSNKTVYTITDEREMVFLGFIAFIDPPKESVKESIKLLKEAGIELKILTGDNELVTRKICEYIGLEIKGVVTGEQVSEADGAALARIVEENNIFCRVTPADKERIITTLKGNGHVVGFLGDGINDAPSLRSADVGISVNNAVDVAKEAADIILLEKRLRVLHDGVIEGRKTFTNTLKYIAIGVSSNFGNMFSVAGASFFLPFLPMLPGQILLNNLLYDAAQIPLPTDNVDREFVEKPRRWSISEIRNAMFYFGPISSIFDFLTFFIMLYFFNATPALFQTAWFTESLITQTLVVYFIRTSRLFYKSRPSKPLLAAGLTVIAVALTLPYTIIGEIFGFTIPPPIFYPVLALIVAAYLITVEVAKKKFYKIYKYKQANSKIYESNMSAQPRI